MLESRGLDNSRLQNEGKTVILVTEEDELEGIIAVADEIRDSPNGAVDRLNSPGIRTVMLTGDNENAGPGIDPSVNSSG